MDQTAISANFIARLPGMGLPSVEAVQPAVAWEGYRQALRFCGKSIDDVIDDPIARRMVRGYWGLGRWIDREVEIGQLDRQWNSLANRARGSTTR